MPKKKASVAGFLTQSQQEIEVAVSYLLRVFLDAGERLAQLASQTYAPDSLDYLRELRWKETTKYAYANNPGGYQGLCRSPFDGRPAHRFCFRIELENFGKKDIRINLFGLFPSDDSPLFDVVANDFV